MNGARRVVLLTGVAAFLLGCGGTSKSDNPGSRVEPCGGDLVGIWAELDEHVTYPAPINVNSCWNLMGSFSADGAYSASSRYPAPQQRRTILTFSADGVYYGAVLRFGPVTVNYAAECLVTDHGSPSCTQLQEALQISGIGEGSYQGATCSDLAGGGCSCTVQVAEVGGPTGTWVLNPDQKSFTLTKPMGSDAPLEVNVGYCIKNGSLRFDTPLDGGTYPSFAYMTEVTFSAPNCAGTPEQVKARYGDNCSGYCGGEVCGETP
ncbi:MAG TPA: hypothetical protein VHP33_04920 [Polyangiaceae bacterium]|nr:hypothetical protein [Polyangiaceae bacterium]